MNHTKDYMDLETVEINCVMYLKICFLMFYLELELSILIYLYKNAYSLWLECCKIKYFHFLEFTLQCLTMTYYFFEFLAPIKVYVKVKYIFT